MLMLISPAKALDESPRPNELTITEGEFIAQADALMQELRSLGPMELSQLMHISDDLAELNYQRNQTWQTPDVKNPAAKQALLMFKGDVYQGLDATSLSARGWGYAHQHLRILSGLYGLLKPNDLMLPYRLEMGTKFANTQGKDLYAFWGEQITQAVNATLAKAKGPLVNLASNEYFKAVKRKKLTAPVITPQFKDWKNGQYKMISFYAKKARGLMVRYAIDHQLQDAEGLKHFDYAGYQFAPELSTEVDWVFTRKLTQ